MWGPAMGGGGYHNNIYKIMLQGKLVWKIILKTGYIKAYFVCNIVDVTTRTQVWRDPYPIPYAYVSHFDTLKCHSVQRQANTPIYLLSPFSV